MGGFGLARPIVSLSEAQAYVRIETGEEEAVLAGLVRTASAICESFIDQVVIARDFSVDVPASGAWMQVPVSPVQSISMVETVDVSGLASAVAALERIVARGSRHRVGHGWSRAWRNVRAD